MESNIKSYSLEVSAHNHTLVSSHAYSTVSEIMSEAARVGLRAVAITDHAPALCDGAPHIWHFSNMKTLPRKINGVYLIRGAEANVLSQDGDIDVPSDVCSKLDLIIASIHSPVYDARDIDKVTETWINIAKNPDVDIIGHSGNELFPYDYERVIKVFKEYGKIVEINNHSFECRAGSDVNCRKIAEYCKKYEVNIVISPDSHFASEVNKTGIAEKMLIDMNFPEKLILNRYADRFFDWIYNKKGIRINEK